MRLTRRSFLELLGTSTAYAFTFSCSNGDSPSPTANPSSVDGSKLPNAIRYFVDYTDWLFIHKDGSVTAHTGRIDMGQGLETVLSNIISQGLQLPSDKVRLVMGDTELCPDDGPTNGSAATQIVGWGYWRACERIREHLITRASEALGAPATELEYRDGAVVGRKDVSRRVEIGEFADGTLHFATIDPKVPYASKTPYTDRRTPNVNAVPIVTGTQIYAGDLFCGEVPYASWLLPEFHTQLTGLESADLEGAARVPGVEHVQRLWKTAMVVGRSFTSVERGLQAMRPRWKVPDRAQTLNVEAELRAGAELERVVEENGVPEDRLAACELVLSETYLTQYASQVPIETETAVAEFEDGRVTAWTCTQAPFKSRQRVAKRLKIPEEDVHIIAMPVGGGFGVKVGTQAPQIAAEMARESGKRVKVVYSRPHQFFAEARYKESVLVDITSGMTADGKIVARTVDLYQDEGFGTRETYEIGSVRTRLFHTEMPARHGTMRGTSYVQTCFAVESHTDMLAELVGIDPVEFRRKNMYFDAFGPLLDTAAELVGYGAQVLPRDHGIGFAMINHGGRQLGVVSAEVAVNRRTGEIEVVQLNGAFDIGLVININTLTANSKGAMLWGLGFALFEEVELDGHRATINGMSGYRIPRFSDVPPIRIAFHDNVGQARQPRGCGEMPVVPTIGAIANAVHDAVGLRFHTLPMTPKRVLEGLRES